MRTGARTASDLRASPRFDQFIYDSLLLLWSTRRILSRLFRLRAENTGAGSAAPGGKRACCRIAAHPFHIDKSGLIEHNVGHRQKLPPGGSSASAYTGGERGLPQLREEKTIIDAGPVVICGWPAKKTDSQPLKQPDQSLSFRRPLSVNQCAHWLTAPPRGELSLQPLRRHIQPTDR